MANRIKTASLTLLTIGVTSIGIGCTRHVYVPVERVIHDTLRQINATIDSVTSRDSIYLDSRGDTVFKEVYRWRTRTKVRVDTVYMNKVDTLRITDGRIREAVASYKSSDKKTANLVGDVIKWSTRTLLLLVTALYILKSLRRR